MTVKSKPQTAETFAATFVQANQGLQTAERVNGRRAFPSRRGAQPKLGETWLVKVDGANPKETVHFVRCIELVSGADATAEEAPVTTADSVVESETNDTGKSKGKKVEIDPAELSIFRANLWLVKPATTDLQNLKLAFAHKCIGRDNVAVELRGQLQATMDKVNTLAGQIRELTDRIKTKHYRDDVDLAERLHAAQVEMARLKIEAKDLQTDTLAYGRLKQKLNAKGETADAVFKAEVEAIKEAIDQRRCVHKEAMAAGKAILEEVEFEYLYPRRGADQKSVDAVLELLQEKDWCELSYFETVSKLAVETSALEERVEQIVPK